MRQESDIDIMLEFEQGARTGLIEFETLVGELESLAGAQVDLVTRRGLKPWVRPPVLISSFEGQYTASRGEPFVGWE